MIKEFIETGEIVGTHGLKGEVRVNPWSDGPEFLKQFKTLYLDAEGKKKLKVLQCRVQKNINLILFDGIDSVEKAAAMRGGVLYINRKDAKLKEGSFFVQDLLDCEVFDAETLELYGRVTDVFQTGANDVWEIKKDEKTFLFPAVKIFIDDLDLKSGKAYIKPPKGTFDDE